MKVSPVTRACVVLALLAHSQVAWSQSLEDPNLAIEPWVEDFSVPSGMALLNNDGDALVIEKNTGRVRLVRDQEIKGTALNLDVANSSEQGLLGIALHPDFKENKFVYLYYTASATNSDGGFANKHLIERYRLASGKLEFDKRIRSMPASPGPNHNGGKIAFGPDGKLYAVVGDLNRNQQTQNNEDATAVRRAGVILRLNPGGRAPEDNPFFKDANGTKSRRARNDIFAYGIRNSFGLDFDPVTGALWDTENGPDNFDEINRVRRGFNSGWSDIMGPIDRNGGTTGELVALNSKEAYYKDPKFTWVSPTAPTDLNFATNILGDEYENDLFVGDANTGTIYHFDLASGRKKLILTGDLEDKVADNSEGNPLDEQEDIVFGSNFGTISDIENGKTGMFVLSLSNGTMYRITGTLTATSLELANQPGFQIVPEPTTLLAPFAGLLLLMRRRRRN